MEIGMSRFSFQLPNFLDPQRLDLSHHHSLNDVFSDVDSREQTKSSNIYLTSSVLAWTLIYMIFKIYFNTFFKHRNFNLLQRNRIIDSLWSWAFHVIGLFYIKFYHLSEVPWSTENPNDSYFIYFTIKGFCLHFVGIKILSCATWMTGFSYLLFTLFVFNDFDNCFNIYILYVCTIKVLDILILEACRFLFILWKDNYGNIFSKFLFMVHCFYWSYMYMYFVPNFLLSSEKEIDSLRLPYFYLWYISECIDSVWLTLFRYRKTDSWLKSYLFSQSKESIELMNIYKRRETKNNQRNIRASRIKKQIDLWKTVKCAIAVKKTLRRKLKAQKESKERHESIQEMADQNETYNDMDNLTNQHECDEND